MSAICVVGGGGYVGLTYAAALADLGHTVIGLDVDATKIAQLWAGRLPIFEPGLADFVARGIGSGRLRFTTEYADAVPTAEFVFLCVNTPSTADGFADLTAVAAAAREIGRHATGRTVIVNKSTMPVGSVQYVTEILAEHATGGASFAVVANPEFLREGSALDDVFHPARIVIGADDPVAAAEVAALYAPLNAPVLMVDPRSAEMIKYASNAFLATKISFVNELALICERLGADIGAVADGMGRDPRIGAAFLRAGAGFGGSCFPKDVRALAAMASATELDPAMLHAVLRTNAAMREQIVAKLTRHLGELAGKTVALLGLAFKPNTDDIRESPAVEIMSRLRAANVRLRATDPVAGPRIAARFPAVELFADPYATAMGADAVVLVTEWDLYCGLDLDHLANAMRGRLLVDARNALDPARVIAAGLRYEGVGRGLHLSAGLPVMVPVAANGTGAQPAATARRGKQQRAVATAARGAARR